PGPISPTPAQNRRGPHRSWLVTCGSAITGSSSSFQVDRMSDFTSEDDLNSFEGWLKYQLGDTILTPDQLQAWRSIYEDCRPSGSFGLMNLKPLRSGEYRYAVALRDGPDLWLTLWVRRDPKGDVYVLVPR